MLREKTNCTFHFPTDWPTSPLFDSPRFRLSPLLPLAFFLPRFGETPREKREQGKKSPPRPRWRRIARQISLPRIWCCKFSRIFSFCRGALLARYLSPGLILSAFSFPPIFRLNFLTDLGIAARGLCIAGFARFRGRIAALHCITIFALVAHVRDSVWASSPGLVHFSEHLQVSVAQALACCSNFTRSACMYSPKVVPFWGCCKVLWSKPMDSVEQSVPRC